MALLVGSLVIFLSPALLWNWCCCCYAGPQTSWAYCCQEKKSFEACLVVYVDLKMLDGPLKMPSFSEKIRRLPGIYIRYFKVVTTGILLSIFITMPAKNIRQSNGSITLIRQTSQKTFSRNLLIHRKVYRSVGPIVIAVQCFLPKYHYRATVLRLWHLASLETVYIEPRAVIQRPGRCKLRDERVTDGSNQQGPVWSTPVHKSFLSPNTTWIFKATWTFSPFKNTLTCPGDKKKPQRLVTTKLQLLITACHPRQT